MPTPEITIAPPKSLGTRLGTLYDIIAAAPAYDVIWDCCCDHGYLGIQLLHQQLAPRVAFVDSAAHLMDQLARRLTHYPAARYQVIAGDAGAVHLDLSQRHLVILAGVGGELSATITEQLMARHPKAQVDFLYCPNTSQFDLRDYLHASQFTPLYEGFIREKKWDYEVLWVSTRQKLSRAPGVDLTGTFWRADNPEHLLYLQKLLKHYQRQMRGCKTGRAERCFNAYRECLSRIT